MKTTPENMRIDRLRRLMEAAGVSSLLVTRREDVRYLTGFTGSAGSLLVSSGKPFLITDFRYQLQAAREAKNALIVIQKKDFFTAFREVADGKGIRAIWFDESSLTVDLLKQLKETGLKAKGSRNLVQNLRMRKDRSELVRLRKAIARAEQAFCDLKPFIKPGVSERFLSLKLEFFMRAHGAKKTAFDSIIASGGNGAMPHATVTNRRIRSGDLVTFDFGAEADGYYCDMTRTYCIGRPAPRQRMIHETVLSAQAEAIKLVRPGVLCKTVDSGARDFIKRSGYGSRFGHGTGHGIGLMVHEGPSVSPLSKDVVEKDMVFTVEPGIYIPGWGGVRIEDMVLATDTGVKMLTSLPRELDGLRML